MCHQRKDRKPRMLARLLAVALATAAIVSLSTAPAGAATSATFQAGTLTVLGDASENVVVVSRNAAGAILVNGGAVSIAGGAPNVANTQRIAIFGLASNDVLSLDEANGALPPASLFGGAGNDALTGGSGADLVFGQAGNDTALGRGGNDQVFGGTENDALAGGDGDDQAFGESGDDRLIWNPGDDTDLNEGGAGRDTVDVNGGEGAEEFALTANGARIRFDSVSPGPFSIDGGTVEQVDLQANGGNDAFAASGDVAALVGLVIDGGAGDDRLSGGNGPDLLLGGDGDDFVDGNIGNDVAFLGAGDDRFQWDPGDGSDLIEGQVGADRMAFNGSGANELFRASANGGRVRFTRNVGNIVMDLNDVEGIDTAAVGGADELTVDDVSGTDLVDAEIDLAGTLGGSDGDAQPDRIVVNAGNGADAAEVLGSGTSSSIVGLAAKVTVHNAEGANDILALNALRGDDSVNASTTPAGIVQLTIDGGGEDRLLGSSGRDMLLGGDGDDFVDGNRDDDLAFLGAGNDRFQWDPGDGSDTVEGQAGSDRMGFNGSNASERIDVSANGPRVRFFRDVANVTMDLDDLERIDFAALGGADDVTVNDVSGTDLDDVNTDLAEPQGGGDGQADEITVNATNGNDAIKVTGAAGQASVTGLPATVGLSGAEGSNDTLTVDGQGGDDTVDASQLAADAIALILKGALGKDTLLGGAGDDRFEGGDGDDVALLGGGDDSFTWNPGEDNDTIEGQAGGDVMFFNGNNAPENIDVSANGGRVRFFRNVANVSMDLNDVEQIAFAALGGADTVVVGDLSGTDLTDVDTNLASTIGGNAGDGQADSVIVNATNGDDVVQVMGATGQASVLGLSARTDITGSEPASDRLTINALSGVDIVEASLLRADAINLIADGGDDDDVLIGSAGDDTLLGGGGDDILLGGPGANVLVGGPGDDIEIDGLTATRSWLADHARSVDAGIELEYAGK